MSQADIDGQGIFLFKKKYFNQIRLLTDEQKGKLLNKICEYRTEGSRTLTMDSSDMLMSVMVDEWQEDIKRYELICEKRRECGKLGGAKKGNQNARKNWEKQAKQPNGGKNNQNKQNNLIYSNSINTITDNKETYISKDIYTKKEEFETFWKTYPHARKGKKNESYEYFKNLDTAEVMKQAQILKRKINAGLLESQYVPACERWIRDFTPLNDDVIKQDLMKICKRHLNKGGDMRQRAMELKQTFGDQLINDTVKAIQQKDNPKNLFTNQT